MSKFIGVILTVVVFGVAFMPASWADNDQKRKLVVDQIASKGVEENTVAALSDVLCGYIAENSTTWNVLCTEDVKSILAAKENALLLGSCSNAACLKEMGALLQADLVLNGSVGKVGRTYLFNLSILDVANSVTFARVHHSVKADDDGEVDLVRAVREAGELLLKDVARRRATQ
jgi:hypothetical protein